MTVTANTGRIPLLDRVATRHPALIIASFVLATLAINLSIWLIGAAAGGSFDHVEDNGTLHTTSAPQGVISMTTIPLALGLTLAVLIAWFWPGVIRIAQVIGVVAALGTIAMTIDARFDDVSTVALAVMHVVIAVTVVIALAAIARRKAIHSS
jgi:hypothetical protein